MEVVDMVKHFKTRAGVFKAVDGVTVSLKPGTITALLGPSGSGELGGGRRAVVSAPFYMQIWVWSLEHVQHCFSRFCPSRLFA